MARKSNSVGIVKAKSFKLGELKLESGKKLQNVKIAYETYGKLNRNKSNAILICHALSGDAHAAGKHRKTDKKKGWYDVAIGPGKTFDTRKYFFICSNVLGGCKGTTGPSSKVHGKGEQYGTEFPRITIKDMVCAQKKLIEHLEIRKLFCVTGGSMGGMQALQWAIDYPDSVHCAIPIACGAKQHPFALAFNDIGRSIITSDPEWNEGKYGKKQPKSGLSIARQLGHITYLSAEAFDRKFGRKRTKRKKQRSQFGAEYEVQSYLDYKGKRFVRRFDANSYLYLTDAIDNFDLTEGGKKKLSDAFAKCKSKFLLISFSSDWLYTPKHVEDVFKALAEAGVPAIYKNLDLPYGHDSFLVYNNTLGNLLLGFLEQEEKCINSSS